jgi:hypothetical protein
MPRTVKRAFHRFTNTVALVGTTGLTMEITNVPIRGVIQRIRVSEAGGTGSPDNRVWARVYQVTPVAATPIRLEVPFTLSPAESQPARYYEVTEGANRARGSLFVTVATDDATADHTVTVELDIEGLANG